MGTVSIQIVHYARSTQVRRERSMSGEEYVSISYDGLQIVLAISEAQHLMEELQRLMRRDPLSAEVGP